MTQVKQVIVMRKDLNMRKGKMVAQGAHASIKDLVRKFVTAKTVADLDEAETAWYLGAFRKVCVYVESEQALLDVEAAARARSLRVHLIEDHGLTEFGGVLTKTCLAIGPHWDEDVDPVTGHLPLL